MNNKIYITVAVLLLTLLAVSIYVIRSSETDTEVAPSTENTLVAWEWQNPYTYREVTIPAAWQMATSDQVEETLLTVTHHTGRSLVYLIYEETIESMSLEEFVEALQPANQKELGTGEFKPGRYKDGQEYFYAGGAKYFGDNLVVTKALIWSDEANHFWRAVSMTNMEFKQLEYEADQLVELLVESTR